MQNRIRKFRAWNKNKKEWVNFTAIVFKRGKVFLRDGFGNHIDGNFEIVEFTGLKDKNSKEIYEGDIVIQKIWNGADDIEEQSIVDEFEGIIVFDTNGWGIQTKGCKDNESEVALMACDKYIKTEVIGNTYET